MGEIATQRWAAARREVDQLKQENARLAGLLDDATTAGVSLTAAFDRLAVEHGTAVAELARLRGPSRAPKHYEPDMDRCG